MTRICVARVVHGGRGSLTLLICLLSRDHANSGRKPDNAETSDYSVTWPCRQPREKWIRKSMRTRGDTQKTKRLKMTVNRTARCVRRAHNIKGPESREAEVLSCQPRVSQVKSTCCCYCCCCYTISGDADWWQCMRSCTRQEPLRSCAATMVETLWEFEHKAAIRRSVIFLFGVYVCNAFNRVVTSSLHQPETGSKMFVKCAVGFRCCKPVLPWMQVRATAFLYLSNTVIPLSHIVFASSFMSAVLLK